MEDSGRRKKSRCEAFQDWIGSPSFYIYVNYVLGAWGDRMWSFAVGLYLVKLSGGLLRLAAIYGFCGGFCVLLFGGLVGHWVDTNRRLKVMVTTLFLQNTSVMLSATAVCATLFYDQWIDNTLNGGMRYICEAVIVVMAICAQMSSMGYKIAIEKDWIVVIAAGNKTLLANLNAVTRAINLTCKLLAPMTVGLIMSFGSDELAAIVIAVWNLVSVFVEFALLRKVYSMVPALSVKGADRKEEEAPDEKGAQEKRISWNPKGDDEEIEEMPSPHDAARPLKGHTHQQQQTKAKKTCVERMFDPFITLVRGWKTYARQRVVYAGLSLAFLYMTVLGFDSITTGYIYANGVKEYLVAIAMGLGGFTGIIGTICFTYSRRRVGLERTGLFAFSAEILCLCLCVASVFTPGSRFHLLHTHNEALSLCQATNNNQSQAVNISSINIVKRDADKLSIALQNTDSNGALNSNNDAAFVGISTGSDGYLPSYYYNHDISKLHHAFSNDINVNFPYHQFHVISKRGVNNTNDVTYNIVADDSESPTEITVETADKVACEEETTWISYLSIILFLLGIVTSRVGLWMADLVVTQLQQEHVIESERGVVNGVQYSLNMLMDMLKFTLVIFVPHIRHFGYLILASFSFICMAGCLFAYHSWRVRGHLFHFGKICGQRPHAAKGSPDKKVPDSVELA